MQMLQGVWKQHLRPRAVVGYGVKIFLPSPPHYVTRSPGQGGNLTLISLFDSEFCRCVTWAWHKKDIFVYRQE